MEKTLQILFRWAVNLILAAAFLLAAAVWLPKAFHMKAYVVMRSSMEPAIKAGSVIYVKPYEKNEAICPGDIISFQAGDVMVTHRVVSADLEGQSVTTKGDANQLQDSAPVPFSNIYGKVRFHIPALGYLLLRQ